MNLNSISRASLNCSKLSHINKKTRDGFVKWCAAIQTRFECFFFTLCNNLLCFSFHLVVTVGLFHQARARVQAFISIFFNAIISRIRLIIPLAEWKTPFESSLAMKVKNFFWEEFSRIFPRIDVEKFPTFSNELINFSHCKLWRSKQRASKKF